jgi:outer membrane murein-binding lipoprotein Lpp
MKRRLCFLILAVVFSTVIISGCCGGGKKETKVVTQTTKTTTKGQELQDLNKAKEEGAINEKEYEDAKKKILKEE